MRTVEPEAAGVERRVEQGPEVSVVIPCLDEARTLGACIRKARESLDALGVESEIIVADNGSTDGSQEIAAAGSARASLPSNRAATAPR